MKASTKRKWKKGAKGWLAALPFVLPGLILVGLFVLYPMIFTIRISFSEYKIVQGQINFIGLSNYVNVLTDPSGRFWYAYRNNFLYALFTVPFIIFGGMIFAYLINNLKRGKTIFKVGFYLPVITSWVIVSLVFTYMFNNSDRGLINYILVDKLHLLDDYVPWLLREWSGNAAIWLMGIWKKRRLGDADLPCGTAEHPARSLRGGFAGRRGRLGPIPAYHDRMPQTHDVLHPGQYDHRFVQRVYSGFDAHAGQPERAHFRFAIPALRQGV